MASRSATSHATPSTGGICPITGEAYSSHTSVVLDHLHPSLAERIRQDHPTLAPNARISRAAADRYRKLHVEELLRQERGELTQLDKDVARSLAEGAMVSINTEEQRGLAVWNEFFAPLKPNSEWPGTRVFSDFFAHRRRLRSKNWVSVSG